MAKQVVVRVLPMVLAGAVAVVLFLDVRVPANRVVLEKPCVGYLEVKILDWIGAQIRGEELDHRKLCSFREVVFYRENGLKAEERIANSKLFLCTTWEEDGTVLCQYRQEKLDGKPQAKVYPPWWEGVKDQTRE